jgi:hypothetical protein
MGRGFESRLSLPPLKPRLIVAWISLRREVTSAAAPLRKKALDILSANEPTLTDEVR